MFGENTTVAPPEPAGHLGADERLAGAGRHGHPPPGGPCLAARSRRRRAPPAGACGAGAGTPSRRTTAPQRARASSAVVGELHREVVVLRTSPARCTAWRSSRFLLLTRSSSPCTWTLTPLGPSSRISLPTFLASSEVMPSLSAMLILVSRPDARGSPASRIFSDCWRLISFSLNTSSTALARSSALAEISMPCLAGPLDLGAGALEVVALRDLARRLGQGVVDLLAVDLADDVERRVGHGWGSSIRFKTWVGAALSSLALLAHTTGSASTAGCPSGQWKRTVNPSAYAYAGSNPAPATSVRRASDLQVCRSEVLPLFRLHPAGSGDWASRAGSSAPTCAGSSPSARDGRKSVPHARERPDMPMRGRGVELHPSRAAGPSPPPIRAPATCSLRLASRRIGTDFQPRSVLLW